MIAVSKGLVVLLASTAFVLTSVIADGCVETEELTWPEGGNPFDISCDVDPETDVDPEANPVSFSCIHPIFEKKCADCHTVGKQGNVEVGHQDILKAYENSQQTSYTGGTIGKASLTRVSDGSMPPGAGCTGNPAADKPNDLCLDEEEYTLLQAWIESGQSL